jgi:hypothetical protein
MRITPKLIGESQPKSGELYKFAHSNQAKVIVPNELD